MTDTGWIILASALGAAAIAAALALLVSGVRGFFKKIWEAVKGLFAGVYAKAKKTLSGQLAGFEYDSGQDIFYSAMNAWQKKLGYCALYDGAAAMTGMIIDCEPVYFEYGGKRWLIEFWKGQYSISTGCEVGVYNTWMPDISIPGVFNGTLYYGVSGEDMPFISYTLYKDGRELFSRSGVHWWLTGFKLGEFSWPSELTARITLGFRDHGMLHAFLGGFYKAGYGEEDAFVYGNTVRFEFTAPRTPQPITRTKIIEDGVQAQNKELCENFAKLTGSGSEEKINAAKRSDPKLYRKALDFWDSGGTRQLFRMISKFGKR